MELVGRDNYNGRLQELEEQEAKWQSYLDQNGGSLESSEAEQIKATLTGIRAEKEQINQIISSGFY